MKRKIEIKQNCGIRSSCVFDKEQSLLVSTLAC